MPGIRSARVFRAACAALQSGGEMPAQLTAAKGASLKACGVIGARFEYPNTQIDAAEPVTPGAVTLIGIPVAQHCLVKGQMFKRKGIDGQDCAIGFEMRLPLDCTDFGYGAVGKLTPMAKAMIATAYGKGPDRSYIGGCSNGGRHTMVAASRYGDQYDGYLVGAPGYRLPNATLAQLWAAPKWNALADSSATVNHPFAPNVKLPDLGSAFTAPERQTVAQAVLQKCDALDGATDGLVQDVKACQSAFDLNRDVATFSGARAGQCLTAAQKTLVGQVFAGSKSPAGQLICSSFPWDTGISTPNWASWKFVNSQVLDPGAGHIFMSPARSIKALDNNDLDEGYRAIYANLAPFGESADAAITPPGKDNPVNLAPLRARGAKMLMYHGVSDAIFSANDTAAWWDRLNHDPADRLQQAFAAFQLNRFPMGSQRV